MTTIGIIGGGINGLFSAYYLQKAGYQVTVLDQGDLSDGCSFGNAGMIVPSHIVPLAAPGMVAKGLRWMLRSDSPFYLRPRINGALARWAWLFFQNSTIGNVEKAVPLLRDLSLLSKSLYQDFHRENHFDFEWHEKGLLMLYQTAGIEHEEMEGAALANHSGIEAHVLTGREIQDLNPGAKVEVRGGVFFPGDAHVNPNKLMAGLKKYLEANGVIFLSRQEVKSFETQSKRVTGVVTAQENLVFDEIVLTAGAWSAQLAAKLGMALPLQGGKGYSFLLKGQGPLVTIPSILLEARATATPMGGDLRCAGTMEIAGLDLSVNMNRVRGIVNGINRFYPETNMALPEKTAVWSGLRPCSPDGLPFIGRLPPWENVTLATGHGMMGLSLGAATGKLVSELVMRESESIPIDGFNPSRF